MRIMSRLAAAMMVACLIAGCSGQPSRVPEPTPEELHRDWLRLADMPAEDLDFSNAQLIGDRLARAGRLDLILDTLGDPAANPKAKVLAVVSLTPMANSGMEKRLLELVAPDRETTTRACAAKLLGLVDSDAARARLNALMDDPEHRVRVTAVLMLVRAGVPAALPKVAEIWASPETQASERIELVLSLPEERLGEFLPLLMEAAVNPELDYVSRRRAIVALGQYGDADAVAVLETAATDPGMSDLSVLAKETLSAVRARLAHSNGAPESDPMPEVPAEEH